jgi:hypothetical protein
MGITAFAPAAKKNYHKKSSLTYGHPKLGFWNLIFGILNKDF